MRQGQQERGLALMDRCVAFEQAVGHPDAAPDAARVAQLRQQWAVKGTGKPTSTPPPAAGDKRQGWKFTLLVLKSE